MLGAERRTVWCLTQTVCDETEIVEIFATRELATAQIVKWVENGDMAKLNGLGLKQYQVRIE